MIHIYAPASTAKTISVGICPDCGKRTRYLHFFTPYIGDDATCLRCGREWMDGQWMPLLFVRGSRIKSIENAKRRWRGMPPVSENHYGIELVEATK